jgi:hypothetical protein
MTKFDGTLFRGGAPVGSVTGHIASVPGPRRALSGTFSDTVGVRVGETLRLETDAGLTVDILITGISAGSTKGAAVEFSSLGEPIAGDVDGL